MLDALARGVPVLATSIAAEGLPARGASIGGLQIEDDLSAWPELISALTPERSRAVSGKARAYFLRSYGRDVVAARYDDMLGIPRSRSVRGSPEDRPARALSE